jgi:beta-glucanase (GH16 family)
MRDVVRSSRVRYGRIGSVFVALALIAGVVVPVAPAVAATTTVVSFGASDWRYYRATAAPPSTWRSVLQPWKKGAAPLGFGHSTGSLRTKLPNSMKTKPLATYFQRTFPLTEIPDGGLTVTTWADDGVLLYVNGKEVLRSNVDGGTPKHERYWASNAPQSAKARTKLVTATIPASVLKSGKNLIAAQVQSNWRATHNVTFDAKVVASQSVAAPRPAPAPAPAPGPAPAPEQPTSPALPGWDLAWADEFNDTVIDPAKWTVYDNSTFGDGNLALACLMEGNVVESGGTLTIRADKLPAPKVCNANDKRFPEGRSYTSGFLETKKKASFTYGRFEVRFTAPMDAGRSKGLWPAFWLRPTDGTVGELDVMEIIGTDAAKKADAGKIVHTLHYDYDGTHPKQGSSYRLPSGSWDSDFHTAAVEWEPGVIRWYIDGVLTYQRTPATTPWLTEAFSRPFYLRLNMAVGGSWPGSPDAETKFPADFVVDYVRVYQRTPQPTV